MKSKQKEVTPIFKDEDGRDYEKMDIAEYTKNTVVLYGVNVSVSRSCALIDDGLIPVQRRILWTMYHDHKLLPSSDYVKVPEFLMHGLKYHPHGDQSLMNAFSSMIRPWDSQAVMIDVDGFKGSVTGDSHAQPRYLDARLSKYAYKCFFEEFDSSIVDMVPNYIQSDVEPIALPCKYPNFLLHVNSGVAWGNAMALTTFNLVEAFNLIISLMWHPEMTDVYLFPDSPRGYSVIDDGTIQKVCNTGRGTVKARAVATYVPDEHCIDVTGLPEQVYMDPLIAQINELVVARKLTGIEDVVDNSTRDNKVMRVILKKGVVPEHVLSELYKKTKMETTIDINMNFSERTHMLPTNLKNACLIWIERRIDYKQKYYIRQITKLMEKKHSLEGQLSLLTDKNIRLATKLSREAIDDDDLIQRLQNGMGISSYQAKIVSDWKLSGNTEKARERLMSQYEQIPVKIKEIEDIISSRDAIKADIQKELEEGIELFGRPRTSKIIKQSTLKEVIIDYRIVITSRYIKKLAAGGYLVGLVDVNDDVVSYFRSVDQNDRLMVLSDGGKLHTINLDKIVGCDASHKGTDLLTAIGLKGKAVSAFLIKPDQQKMIPDLNMYFFTESGLIKATPLEQYVKTRTELQAISLSPGDKVCFAGISPKTEVGERLIYTKNGMGIAIDLNQVAITDRVTKGTQYLKFTDDDDSVVGVCDTNCDEICIITMNGYGKICALDDVLRTTKRKADMVRLISLSENDSVYKVIPVTEAFNDSTLVYYLASGEKKKVPCKEIKRTTRISKGSKLTSIRKSDSILRIKITM